MVKITADLISRSSQFLNPVKEFQLDLRGYKVLEIENLTATNDQFGCIDLTDNAITKINQLPKLNRLRSLVLINNRINKIEPNFSINCPYFENLILTNNKISNITELDNIASCKTLIRLSLVDNLVTKIKYYRQYVIFKMPNLRVLDFQKVKKKERISANELFTSKEGQMLIEDLVTKKFKTEDNIEYFKALQENYQDENKKKQILNLINSAKDLDQIKKIEKALQLGTVDKEFLQKEDVGDENNIYKN